MGKCQGEFSEFLFFKGSVGKYSYVTLLRTKTPLKSGGLICSKSNVGARRFSAVGGPASGGELHIGRGGEI